MDSKKVITITKLKPQKVYEFKQENRKFEIFIDKTFKEYFMKWNMDANFEVMAFSFQCDFESMQDDQIICDFFRSKIIPDVLGCQASTVIDNNKEWNIEIEAIPCTILSMDFFDRIYENGITLPGGTIRKCFEEYIDDIVVADELRNMLLVHDSDKYTLYQEDEREEFLFRIFRHLCIGGVLNQYEDNIEPYILMSKAIYKDLLCVRKVGLQKKTTITSKVYKIVIFDDNLPVYPSANCHQQDFSYIIINSSLNEVIMVKHTW